MHILQYKSGSDRQSIMHGIPMQYLDEIKRLFAIDGVKIKVRYRGPRSHRYNKGESRYRVQTKAGIIRGINYSVINAHSTCLKSDAVTFAVYRR
jgi:hypothetical protein